MPSPYNYLFDTNSNTYNFTTKNRIEYSVAFIVDHTFSTISGEEIPNIFQLVIEKVTDEIEPLDSNVFKTIKVIIEVFLRKIENSIVYICSNENDKASIRHVIFDRWHKNSIYRDEIIKLDNVIRVSIDQHEEQIFFTSFMFNKQNPDSDRLIKIFNLIEKALNEVK